MILVNLELITYGHIFDVFHDYALKSTEICDNRSFVVLQSIL